MSTIGTVSHIRPESFAPGSALGTRFALALLAEGSDAIGASSAPAAPQPVPAIPVETGVDFTTLFTVRFAAALRAAARRRAGAAGQRSTTADQPSGQQSGKRGLSW